MSIGLTVEDVCMAGLESILYKAKGCTKAGSSGANHDGVIGVIDNGILAGRGCGVRLGLSVHGEAEGSRGRRVGRRSGLAGGRGGLQRNLDAVQHPDALALDSFLNLFTRFPDFLK